MDAVVTGDHRRSAVGGGLAAVSVALMVAVALEMTAETLLSTLVVTAFAGAGATLVRLRPRNLLGWLLVASGLMLAISEAAGAYGTRALTDADGSLPFGLFATWLGSWTLVPALLLPVLVMPALYPSGQAPSRFWRWHVRVSLTGTALLMLAAATVDEVTNEAVAGTRLPWHAPTWWAWATVGSSLSLIVTSLGVVVAGTMLRVARASSPERQQLLWLVCVVGVMVATLLLPASEVPFMVAFACIPLAVLVGVLRYRLLGIEIVLRRALLYAPLTLLVAFVVGALTTVLARLVPDGPLPLLGASAMVAVLVIPVAGRLRLLVDRLVLGERPDPLTVVDRVGAGLETPSDDPVAAMLEAVAAATGASYASVRDSTGNEVASVGAPGNAQKLDVSLVHDGIDLGVLSVCPRRGERTVTGHDQRLVHALAPHLAVVVSSRRLAEDLARERQRVTAATLAERDRLRRDLHDGLGPSLSGIALGLEAAGTALHRDPRAVAALLQRTRDEAEAAVRETRRVLDGLRPAALDRQSLVGAVREAADHLGMGTPGRPRLEMAAEALPVLPPELEESAFRILTEAMTNAARHSDAGSCRVAITQVNGDLHVGVVDDGHGFASFSGRAGHGLDSMRKRASEVGGLLTVAPVEPHGTAVTAVLPLKASS